MPRNGGKLRQDLLRGSYIFMRKDVDPGPRKAAAVDDTGVIQSVGNDVVLRAEYSGYRPRIGGEAGLKDHARLHVLESRDALFKVHVDRHGPGDRSHCARAHTVFPCRFERGFAQLGMRSESQIIVRSEIDYLMPVEAGCGRALRLQYAQRLIGPGPPPRGKLFSQEGQRGAHHS